MSRARRYSPEVRERAVRLVLQASPTDTPLWASFRSISEKIGCTPQTLANGIRKSERRPDQSRDERARLKELDRENRALRRANEILRKASAYFAQAELDRRPR